MLRAISPKIHLRESLVSATNKICFTCGFKIGIHISFSTFISRSAASRGCHVKVWKNQNIDYIKSYFGKLASRNANVAWSISHLFTSFAVLMYSNASTSSGIDWFLAVNPQIWIKGQKNNALFFSIFFRLGVFNPWHAITLLSLC